MSLQAAAKKAAPKAKEPHTIRKAEFLERMMTKTDWSKSQCELALGSVLGTIEEVREGCHHRTSCNCILWRPLSCFYWSIGEMNGLVAFR